MASDGNGIPPSGSASDNASGSGAMNPDDIAKLVNDAVSKALGARMKRLNIEEQISAVVEKTIAAKLAPQSSEAASPTEAPPTMAEGNDIQSNRANLKTVDARLRQMEAELNKERQARAAAEQSAMQARLQSDLKSTFAKHAGADNPHLPAYLNHYASQFKVHEGQTYRVRKNEFGDEELVPLDVAADEMFKSELKHLVPQRSQNLPPASIARGMPFAHQASQQRAANPLLQQIGQHFAAHGDLDKAAILLNGDETGKK